MRYLVITLFLIGCGCSDEIILSRLQREREHWVDKANYYAKLSDKYSEYNDSPDLFLSNAYSDSVDMALLNMVLVEFEIEELKESSDCL